MNESPSNIRTSWPYYFGKPLSLHVDKLRIMGGEKLKWKVLLNKVNMLT